jgi:hypothetical protein
MKTNNIQKEDKIKVLTAELSTKNSDEKNIAILKELAMLCGDVIKTLPDLTEPMKELLNGITKYYLPNFKEDITQPGDHENPKISDQNLEILEVSEVTHMHEDSNQQSTNIQSNTLNAPSAKDA